MGVRTKQALIAIVGAAITLTMLWLGLWQMRVFEDKENESAAARAAQAPVPLLDFVAADATVGDVYGKPVTAVGEYLPDQQLPVVAEDGSVRVLSAFRLDDGRVLPIVRGSLPAGDASLPRPPAGRLTQTGVFLPSEAGTDADTAPGALGSVRLAALAQLWPQQLIPGFITVPAADSASQGLGPAELRLPTGEGSIQNAGYALQWWVFAAFAAFMSFRFVRTIGRQGSLGTLSSEEAE
ncbi:MAG: SURF1 family protein [Propionicimonas sp.]